MIQQIKELRVRIDALHQLTKELKPMDCNTNNPGLKNNSKEIEKATDSLYLAKAWLGKLLEQLNPDTKLGENFSEFKVFIQDIEFIDSPAYISKEVIPGFSYLYKGRVIVVNEIKELSSGEKIAVVVLMTSDPKDHILISSNPYSSGKKTVEDIEPTADTLDMGEAISRKHTLSTVAQLQEMSHIEKVDWLRSEITKVSKDILKVPDIGFTTHIKIAEYAMMRLEEAKMWLGQEFARIREESK